MVLKSYPWCILRLVPNLEINGMHFYPKKTFLSDGSYFPIIGRIPCGVSEVRYGASSIGSKSIDND